MPAGYPRFCIMPIFNVVGQPPVPSPEDLSPPLRAAHLQCALSLHGGTWGNCIPESLASAPRASDQMGTMTLLPDPCFPTPTLCLPDTLPCPGREEGDEE